LRLYKLIQKKIEGYLGILHGTDVQYHQVADLKLAMRLYDGFRWSVSIAFDKGFRRKISEMQDSIRDKMFSSHSKLSLKPY